MSNHFVWMVYHSVYRWALQRSTIVITAMMLGRTICRVATPLRAGLQLIRQLVDVKPSTSIQQNILFEDNHLIVMMKQPAVLIQGDNTEDESLLDMTKSYIAEKYQKKGDAYLGLVHRIDRPCSGVVVFARTSKAAARISKAFSDREVEKKYVCVVHGLIAHPGVCHHLLKPSVREGSNKVSVREVSSNPQYSKTSGERLLEAKLSYKPLWSFSLDQGGGVCTVMEVDLETGRKHQIRAQLSHIGHPICGDLKYTAPAPNIQSNEDVRKRRRGGKGRARPDSEEGTLERGIALHAFSLTVPHPITKERMKFTAKLPSTWSNYFGADIAQRINYGLLL